jgi:hypothetical protein
MSQTFFTGGCLCGAVRYEANEPPTLMGHCYCADCRKASGSGFIPFAGFRAGALRITGAVLVHRMTHADGREAVRNSCAACGGLVFGGLLGIAKNHTIYAGSFDDPSMFQPSIAIFARDRAAWAIVPPGLKIFDGMPG